MNKRILPILLTLMFLVSCDVFQGDKQKDDSLTTDKVVEEYYTCSMHPNIKESRPGKCPVCHMNLTKVTIDKTESKDDPIVWQCLNYPSVTSTIEELCPIDGTKMVRSSSNSGAKIVAEVRLRKAQLDHFWPDYFPVTSMKMTKKIRLLGSVLQSEEKESNIPARIGGRVEKVYVKSTGSLVSKGDPVIDLYSPKLITAGEEFLLAKKSYHKTNGAEFKEMLSQSIEKLELWGIKKTQYNRWYERNKVPTVITIFSGNTGIVRHRMASVGKYFKEGESYFHLADLADVWVEMDVYEHDSSLIKIGQKVDLEFTALPGETLVGEIDFVSPVLNFQSRTLKVRATITNSLGKLKPGMIANATLNVDISENTLVIPRTAVIDTGKRKVVWSKKSKNKFQAIVIKTGHESEGYIEIKDGLVLGDEVVIEGAFLLDAQAQLFGGYEKFKKQN